MSFYPEPESHITDKAKVVLTFATKKIRTCYKH